MKNHLGTKGFTLVETLLYLALLSVLIAGMMQTAYALSSGRDTARATLAFEGAFLMDKLQGELKNAQSVASPAPGRSGVQLALVRVVGIDASGEAMTEPDTFDSSFDMHIAALNFYHATTTQWGVSRDAVGVYLKLSMLGSDGMPVSETFTSTTTLQN